jgi:hypothetical protein
MSNFTEISFTFMKYIKISFMFFVRKVGFVNGSKSKMLHKVW